MLSTSTSTYVPSGLSTSTSTEIKYSSTTSTSTKYSGPNPGYLDSGRIGDRSLSEPTLSSILTIGPQQNASEKMSVILLGSQ